jgi:1-phosphofructokinase family hexose kinase
VIVTVTLNPAIDKSLSVPSLRLGRRHRTVERRSLAGGKGVNVARLLKTLDVPVIATGFAGGPAGLQIVEQLTREQIVNDFVAIQEESRTNTVLLDPTTGEETEINEQGPAIDPHELALFRDKLLYLARGAAIVVIAGSLPRGVEPDFYSLLVRELRKRGAMTVIDTDGDALRHAVRAEPDLVTPNVHEAEELIGQEFGDDEDLAGAVREIVGLGAREALMTAPDGCWAQILVDGAPQILRARIAPREQVAKVGSGDAFLAGYLAARYTGAAPAECLRFAVACGAESTERLGAGLIDPRAAERLRGEVELTPIPLAAGVG